MKQYFYLIILFLPLAGLSQENSISELNSLNHRISELKKAKNRRKIVGQEVTYFSIPRIKFDFTSPRQITIPIKLKQGEFFQVEITGLNLNQYFVLIGSKDTVYSKPLSFPSFGTLDLSSLVNLVSNLSSKTNIMKEEKVIEAFANIPHANLANKSFDNSIFQIAENKVTPFLVEYDRKMKIHAFQKELRELIKSRFTKMTLLANLYLKELKITHQIIDDKNYNYMAYRILRQTNDTSNQYKPEVKIDLKDFELLNSSLKKLKEKIDSTVNSLQVFMETDTIKVFLSKEQNLDLQDNLTKAVNALVEASTKTSFAINLTGHNNVERQLKSILNLYKSQTYTSLPIQFNGEEAKTSIKFIPKDSASTLQRYDLFPIRIPTQKYYWSVGPAIYQAGFVNERVGNEIIYINDSTQRFRLLKENSLKGEMGAALLLRGGVKIMRSSIGVHFSTGSGISLMEEVRPRMLLGGGLTVGQKHSISIDIGSIGGFVKVVSNNADYSKEYFKTPDVLINEFKFEVFWSAGYAFRF